MSGPSMNRYAPPREDGLHLYGCRPGHGGGHDRLWVWAVNQQAARAAAMEVAGWDRCLAYRATEWDAAHHLAGETS